MRILCPTACPESDHLLFKHLKNVVALLFYFKKKVSEKGLEKKTVYCFYNFFIKLIDCFLRSSHFVLGLLSDVKCETECVLSTQHLILHTKQKIESSVSCTTSLGVISSVCEMGCVLLFRKGCFFFFFSKSHSESMKCIPKVKKRIEKILKY